MSTTRRAPGLVVLLGCAVACTAESVDSGEPPCESCALSDDNNYTYEANLHIGTFQLTEATDFTIDFSGLTTDIHGAAIDPAEVVVKLTLAVFLSLTPEQIAEGLTNDTLAQADITLFTTCYPTTTACGLDEFAVLGSSPELAPFFLEGNGNWLVALTGESMSLAYGLAILQADPASTETTAWVDADTSALDLSVDLGSLRPVTVPAATPAIDVSWSDLSRNGLGAAFEADAVDQVLVGRYDEDLGALESQAWDLVDIAAESWSLSVDDGEDAVDLSALEGDRAFPGVDADSTWLLALRCTTCVNPAPPFLTVLKAP